MQDRSLFPWRAPLSADWVERWSATDARVRALAECSADAKTVDEVCIALRRLANEQLGPREQLKLENLARRLVPVAHLLKPLRHFRIGLIGNRTLSFLVSPLRAAGLSRGLLIDVLEAPYDSARSFALGGVDVFGGEKLDAVVVLLDEGAFVRPAAMFDRAGEDAAIAEAVKFLKRIATAGRDSTGAGVVVATMTPTAPLVSSADLATAGTLTRFVTGINA